MLQKFKELFTIKKQIIFIVLPLFLFFCFIFLTSLPPKNFNSGYILDVEKGETVKMVASKLKENKIIKSEVLSGALIEMSRSHVVTGRYIFKNPENLFTVVRKIAKGDYGSTMAQITFFEGMTTKEMGKAITFYFPNFNEKEFVEITKTKEGYLFPDTYKLSDLMTSAQVIEILESNFQNKIKSIDDLVKNSKYSLEEIIIMASIVEKEATADSRQEVANILWKRYEMNFPLQVDAPFVYSIGKGTFDLTKSDLKSDDPFNTYSKIGLIPSPISNPGLDSIKAAANPQPTKNLYFLTGQDGKMYYAKTFEEHKKNRLLYLD